MKAFSEKGEIIANKVQIDFVVNDFIEGCECTYNLYVIKNLAYDMVLGIDFLSDMNVTLRCSDDKFSLEFGKNPRKTSSLRKSMNVISIKNANIELNELINNHEELFRDEIGRVNNYKHEIRVML